MTFKEMIHSGLTSWVANPSATGNNEIIDPANLPPAIRITFDFADRQGREVETLSRIFWTGTN